MVTMISTCIYILALIMLGTPDRFAHFHDVCEMGCLWVGQVLFRKVHVYMRGPSPFVMRIRVSN